MAECKECFYYELCNYNARQEAHFAGNMHKYISLVNQVTCKFFINKADYDREQYAKGYYDGMSAIVEKIKEKYGQQDKVFPQRIINITGRQLNNLLKEMAGEK